VNKKSNFSTFAGEEWEGSAGSIVRELKKHYIETRRKI